MGKQRTQFLTDEGLDSPIGISEPILRPFHGNVQRVGIVEQGQRFFARRFRNG